MLLLDEPSAALDPRQRERAVGVRAQPRRRRARRSSTRPTTSRRPSATPTACSCSPTASCCSPARRASSSDAVEARPAAGRDFEEAFVAFLRERGPLMRWLLAQGPADPAPLAAAGGAARALPGRHRRADRLRALARPGQARGGVRQPRARRAERASSSAARRSTSPSRPGTLFDAIDPVAVDRPRAEALQKVEDGDVLAALVIPRGRHATKLQSSGARAGRRSRCSTTPRTRSRRATSRTRSSRRCRTRTRRSPRSCPRSRSSYLDLIGTGGEFTLPRPRLRRARASSARSAILRAAQRRAAARTRRRASSSTR